MRPLLRVLVLSAMPLALLFVAAHLRRHNLGASPAWFRDEGTYAVVALDRNWPPRLGPITVTFVGPYMTQPPFYFPVVRVIAKTFFGTEIDRDPYRALRAVNALIGLLAAVLVFGLAWESCGSYLLAAGAMAVFACHPDMVMYHRMILPYNLAQVWLIVVAWALVRYAGPRGSRWHLMAAAAFAALASLTTYYAIALIAVTIGVALVKGVLEPNCAVARSLPGGPPRGALAALWRSDWWIGALGLLPLVGMLWFLQRTMGDGFSADWAALRRDAAAGSLYTTLIRYWDACKAGLIVPVGAVGLFFIDRRSARLVLLAALFAQAHMFLRRSTTIVSLVPYPLVPLYPLLSIGVAQAAAKALAGARQAAGAMMADAAPCRWPRERLAALVSGLCVAAFAALTGWFFVWQSRTASDYARTGFVTPLRHSMVASVADARAVADWIGARTREDELVIADQSLWPLLRCRVANVPQLLAFRGVQPGSDFYEYHIAIRRFAYSPELAEARFLVEDARLRHRLVDPPSCPEGQILLECRQRWRLAFELGEYRVWENPSPN